MPVWSAIIIAEQSHYTFDCQFAVISGGIFVIRNFLSRFMIGRYGPDQLSTALIVVSFIVSLVITIVKLPFGWIISYLPLILALVRILSRNITARRRENDRFLRFWAPFKAKVKKFFKKLRGMKTHKYFNCPGCKNTLRVPRGRGKLNITCPRCGERFIKKS